MYASSIVEERLSLVIETLKFRPEYHTPQEIDDFGARLEAKHESEFVAARTAAQGSKDPGAAMQSALLKSLANPESPRLTSDEVHFIENERAVVMCDAAYWLTRYYWLKNRENVLQRFAFQAGQRVYFDVISELESMRAAIEIIAAKARQLGLSTITEGLALHKVCFSHGVNGVVASADRTKTGLMAQMMFLAYDMMPWWLRPITTRRVESDQGMIVFGGSRSGVSFQHGSQTSGIARGSTPIAYHLSECASFSNADQLIDASLFKAVHPSPRVFGVLESTCEGNTGWWYDTYWFSKANWKQRKSRLMALFLPFYMGTDMYPNETWIRTRPVPKDWRPTMETRAMMAESRMYVASNPVLQKVLGEKWTMPREVAWYWECNFLEHRAKGKEKLWMQEMPHSDKAAFQGSFENVFGREVIATAYTQRDARYHVYSIIGQSIEDRHEPDPDEVDYEGVRVPVSYESRKGDTYRWELVPMIWEEPFTSLDDLRDDTSHMGKLFVFLPPEPGYDYAIGVDTSCGIGEDATCIAVSRRARSAMEPDVQAAEFRSDKVSHVEAYAWALAIAAYYARYMPDSTQYREPYVSVEQILAVGDTCQLQMQKMGYNRFHHMVRYDSRPKDMQKSKSRKRGWFTTSWSRPMLTDGFVVLVQNGWYVVNSPYTLWEMDHWEVHTTGASGKTKFEHSDDSTDDGIFANAMAAFCPNDLKSMAERSKKQISSASQNPKICCVPIPRGNVYVSP